MSVTVRKVLYTGHGGVENVSVVTAELPPPAANEVQVKIIYSGFNGGDINMRLGVYPQQRRAPMTPGYCFVGRVQANGAGSSKFHKGDLVVALSKYDAEAEFANYPEKYLIALPEGVELEQAVPMILDWATAYGMVKRAAKVTLGQRVFIHGLSGAVGYGLFKLCQIAGAEIYGTASASNHDALKKEGAHPFVYNNKDWIQEMKKIGGAHAVFDPLGYESYDESWSILAPEGGILVGYGGNLNSLNGEEPKSQLPMIAKLIARGLVPFCPQKTTFFYIDRDQKTYVPELHALFELSKQGKIHVPIKKIWDLEEVPEAHRQYTSTKGMGSMLVKISDDTL